MELRFIGSRTRDFTTEVNGNRYYVEIGKALDVTTEDARALMSRDPQLWERVPAKHTVKVEPEEKAEG